MNLIFLQSSYTHGHLSTLSRLGLNVSVIRKNTRKRKTSAKDVANAIGVFIELISAGDPDVYYDICESCFFKKETLFKNIWLYKSNVMPDILITIMKDEQKKQSLIERLSLMVFTLNSTISPQD